MHLSLVKLRVKVNTVTGVTVSQKTATMKVGDTKKVSAIVQPTDATNQAIAWSSDNEAIATVAQDGTITAVAEGTANVTVTTQDGNKKDSVSVTVNTAG